MTMKKILLILISVLALAGMAKAQSITFSKGTGMLNAGLGMGSTLYSSGHSMLIPPVSVSYDHSILSGFIDGNGSIGLGGYLGYTAARYKYNENRIDSNYLILGVRGTFHYEFVPKLDSYLGLMFSYTFSNSNMSGFLGPKPDSDTTFGYSGFLGLRYMFTPRFGGFAEFGYGVSFGNIGLSWRF